MTEKDLSKLVDSFVAQLGEHFDAVQILVSLPLDGGGTGVICRGCGNWYARQGMAHEFISLPVARENAAQIAGALRKPEDEG